MPRLEVGQRVKTRLAELGIGPVEAAQSVEGLEKNFLRDLVENRKRSFSATKAPLVAKALRWTEAELRGEPAEAAMDKRPRVVQVPLLDKVAAGRLAPAMSQIPDAEVPKFAFSGLGTGEFFALRVDGTSMNRVSPDGSMIIVNKADRALINGKFYVFALHGEATYKRWHAEPQYLEPYSTDLDAHRPIFVTRKRDLEVIGRVKRTVLDL